MPLVVVRGWLPGFRTVSFIQLLQGIGKGKYSLPEAKALVDSLLSGNPFEIEFDLREEAITFANAATDLGAIAKEKHADDSGTPP